MRLLTLCRCVAALSLCLTAIAQAPSSTVPRLIRFSGTHASDRPSSGIVGATFSIFAEEHGGTPLWSETQNIELDKEGHYNVMLGSSSNDGMPAELFAAESPRWLEVKLYSPVEAVKPRVLLVSVPYALK